MRFIINESKCTYIYCATTNLLNNSCRVWFRNEL